MSGYKVCVRITFHNNSDLSIVGALLIISSIEGILEELLPPCYYSSYYCVFVAGIVRCVL